MAQSADNARTYSILCWIFAPITGLIWQNESDPDLKWHAKHTMYFGIASVILYIVTNVLATISFGILCCVPLIWSVIDLIIRIYGAVKASQGVRWEVPGIAKFVK